MVACNGRILNNTIVNSLIISPATWMQARKIRGGGLSACKGQLIGNIVWATSPTLSIEFSNNSVPSYSCIKGWAGGGTKNIAADPRFVDPTKGNWRLRPGSPCIDAAQTTTALPTDFDARPRGRRVNSMARGSSAPTAIGAFEYQPGP
jgi:hypothetical protein